MSDGAGRGVPGGRVCGSAAAELARSTGKRDVVETLETVVILVTLGGGVWTLMGTFSF